MSEASSPKALAALPDGRFVVGSEDRSGALAISVFDGMGQLLRNVLFGGTSGKETMGSLSYLPGLSLALATGTSSEFGYEKSPREFPRDGFWLGTLDEDL